jgi:dTDP-glucose pyrophosphorylase
MESLEMYKSHIVPVSISGREALQTLDNLPEGHPRTLFVTNNHKMVGSLTYGDIRRGLLKGSEITDQLDQYLNKSFRSLTKVEVNPAALKEFRNKEIWLLPVLNGEKEIVDIIDLKNTYTVIPAAALIMAGGRGERLKPLTDTLPKPMLKVGDRPIIEINVDRLMKFGIKKFYISVGYLSEKIIEHFGDGSSRNVSIEYIHEEEPLGTIGACCKIENLESDHLLVMNSDILSNIDFEDLYNFYRAKQAMMCVASIPYNYQLPYGILQHTADDFVTGLVEKPAYTYYANAGIYILGKELIKKIPSGQFYNATDLMQQLINEKQKLLHYPILQYWLDIGKYEDYFRAQQDYKHLNF